MLIEEGRRILIFSQFTTMLALIEEHLVREKIPYLKLTGASKDRGKFGNKAVRAYILSNMVLATDQIDAVGYGESRPVANNDTEEGRAQNRRIDVLITID